VSIKCVIALALSGMPNIQRSREAEVLALQLDAVIP
jgi:hypothetical protein